MKYGYQVTVVLTNEEVVEVIAAAARERLQYGRRDHADRTAVVIDADGDSTVRFFYEKDEPEEEEAD